MTTSMQARSTIYGLCYKRMIAGNIDHVPGRMVRIGLEEQIRDPSSWVPIISKEIG
jgi:hypothetical protein